MTVVGMDEECLRSIQESKTLAGIFQSVAEDCKVSTHWSKLSVSMVSVYWDTYLQSFTTQYIM